MSAGKVKVGLVGLGNIGKVHLNNMRVMKQVELVGVCDFFKENADRCAAQYETTAYYSYADLFERSGLEAIIIAVPHTAHMELAIEAFKRGVHVLCEKPLAVHVNEAQKVIDAYQAAVKEHPGLAFGMMFQERALPGYLKIKEIVQSGELGRLTRVSWINTDWFRSQAYYNSGGWRATWAGEGGGILTNQCPHNLDFYQWVFGVPNKITGHAQLGKYHKIEVEDEVTAYFEHDNGMIGHFYATTAESPGTNRLEIVGENGKLVYENNKLLFSRNRISMLKYLNESRDGFGTVEADVTEISLDEAAVSVHKEVAEKFMNRVLRGEGELVAEGTEGIKSITIANGIMLSSFTGRTVELPFDSDEYERRLNDLIRASRFVKQVDTAASAGSDVSKSFTK